MPAAGRSRVLSMDSIAESVVSEYTVAGSGLANIAVASERYFDVDHTNTPTPTSQSSAGGASAQSSPLRRRSLKEPPGPFSGASGVAVVTVGDASSGFEVVEAIPYAKPPLVPPKPSPTAASPPPKEHLIPTPKV